MGMEARTVRDVRALKVARDIFLFLFLFLLVFFSFYWGVLGWLGLVGSDWVGLDRIGLGWTGLGWLGWM